MHSMIRRKLKACRKMGHLVLLPASETAVYMEYRGSSRALPQASGPAGSPPSSLDQLQPIAPGNVDKSVPTEEPGHLSQNKLTSL